eukprot:gene12899-27212_t
MKHSSRIAGYLTSQPHSAQLQSIGVYSRILMDLNAIISQAVSLRKQSDSIFRTKFVSWPSWYQNSIIWRQENEKYSFIDFDNRLTSAILLKIHGNELYLSGKYSESIVEYEKALAAFLWITPLSKCWNGQVIQDDQFLEHRYAPKSSQERDSMDAFLAVCYTNLAAVYLKTGETATSIQASTAALQIDPCNKKALYRRAKARLAMRSAAHKDDELDAALQDLIRAQELDPHDRAVNETYRMLKQEIRDKKQRERIAYRGCLSIFKDEVRSSGGVGVGVGADGRAMKEKAEEEKGQNEASLRSIAEKPYYHITQETLHIDPSQALLHQRCVRVRTQKAEDFAQRILTGLDTHTMLTMCRSRGLAVPPEPPMGTLLALLFGPDYIADNVALHAVLRSAMVSDVLSIEMDGRGCSDKEIDAEGFLQSYGIRDSGDDSEKSWGLLLTNLLNYMNFAVLTRCVIICCIFVLIAKACPPTFYKYHHPSFSATLYCLNRVETKLCLIILDKSNLIL